MLGFGWCHLRSSREAYRDVEGGEVDIVDSQIDEKDIELFADFREMMIGLDDPWIVWELTEHLNNDSGLLTLKVSRNHRTSAVWEILDWIVRNAPESYGLFYCHDDEDFMDRDWHGRNPPMDFHNVYRVHRILNGKIDELDDPFFGQMDGDFDPVHPSNKTEFKK